MPNNHVSSINILILLIVAFIITCQIPITSCSGSCDTEEFKPGYYWYYHCDGSGKTTDCWYLMEKWYTLPSVFDENHWYVVDFLRTVSCTNGDNRNVYDYRDRGTDLPGYIIVDIEEWSLSCLYCDEEAEIGTEDPELIEPNMQYYIVVYFDVVLSNTVFGMRFEPELEYAGGQNVD